MTAPKIGHGATPEDPYFASCLECRRTLDRHMLRRGAGTILPEPAFCGWCGRPRGRMIETADTRAALAGFAKIVLPEWIRRVESLGRGVLRRHRMP